MSIFHESFTGTPGTDLAVYNPEWVKSGPGSALIGSNGTSLRCASTSEAVYKAPDCGSPDHYVEATWLGFGQFFMAVRLFNIQNFIGFRVYDGSLAQIYKRVGNSFTLLAQRSTTFTPGGRFRLWVNGNTANVTRLSDGSELFSNQTLNDSVFTGVTSVGLVSRTTLADPWLDDWESPVPTAPVVVSLQPSPITAGQPVLGAASFAQRHSLVASPLSASAPILAAPQLAQRHQLQSAGLTAGSPQLGYASLSSGLSAQDLEVNPPQLGRPFLSPQGEFGAESLLTGHPLVGMPVLIVSGHQASASLGRRVEASSFVSGVEEATSTYHVVLSEV